MAAAAAKFGSKFGSRAKSFAKAHKGTAKEFGKEVAMESMSGDDDGDGGVDMGDVLCLAIFYAFVVAIIVVWSFYFSWFVWAVDMLPFVSVGGADCPYWTLVQLGAFIHILDFGVWMVVGK